MDKKDMYNKDLLTKTYVNGETAIKPYYYFRNGYIHIRYTVDRCIKLSPDEAVKVKDDLTKCPYDKQFVLEKNWSFFTKCVGKAIIEDGIAEMEKRIKEYKNGQQN